MEVKSKKLANREFSEVLEKRTEDFALSIIKLSIQLPNTQEGKVFKNQLTKSGTSVGANYREANRSRSPNDFKNRIRISESEASETLYWLSLISKLKWIEDSALKPIIAESKEILAIFTSISTKLKNKN